MTVVYSRLPQQRSESALIGHSRISPKEGLHIFLPRVGGSVWSHSPLVFLDLLLDCFETSNTCLKCSLSTRFSRTSGERLTCALLQVERKSRKPCSGLDYSPDHEQ